MFLCLHYFSAGYYTDFERRNSVFVIDGSQRKSQMELGFFQHELKCMKKLDA